MILCFESYNSDGYSNGLKFMLEIVKGKNSKKAKAEPTKEEMHSVIVDILKRVDFNTVCNSGTCSSFVSCNSNLCIILKYSIF